MTPTVTTGYCAEKLIYFSRKPERRQHLEDLGVDGRIILEWILGKLGGMVWTEFILVRIGISGGHL
jgi:hypothetical protein